MHNRPMVDFGVDLGLIFFGFRSRPLVDVGCLLGNRVNRNAEQGLAARFLK